MGCFGSKDKLSKEDMDFLKSHTRYDEATIKEWYKGFKQDCPNGRLTPAKFVDMYKMFFPSGNAEEFCDHVFRTFDMDKNGYIDFKFRVSVGIFLPFRASEVEVFAVDGVEMDKIRKRTANQYLKIKDFASKIIQGPCRNYSKFLQKSFKVLAVMSFVTRTALSKVGSREINAQEFLLAIDVTSSGTPEEKLKWAFRMYDVDGNGVIDIQEMTKIVQNKKGLILLNDNVQLHVSLITVQKFNDLRYETPQHPRYSPDLSPTNYHLFKHFNHFIKEKTVRNERSVKHAFVDFVDSRPCSFFTDGINKLAKLRQMCIDCDDSYFA
ncbi:Neuronal calcium sensor 2 [Habropoda laboriosa]|uniref:Neuronal calcium sensor 2 n=1 Tax=Habropoda laboriosa TaxID=597456 RepID=A0A0L7RE71_9HYME|nr:Neuronal calcium sensor 2 [Habropoda laboriosa]